MARQPKAQTWLEIRLDEAETDDDSRLAYNDVYDNADITQPVSFYLWVMDLLHLKPTDVYLDISCGQGQLVELAQEKGVEAHGLDLSEVAVNFGRNQHHIHNLTTANSQILPYVDNSFTTISSMGSLEHYVDMPLAVREMARVLDPSGHAYVLVPNTFSLLNNIWIAYRKGLTSADPHQPIQRYGARVEWQNLLEENGLIVEKTLKYERPRPRTKEDALNFVRRPKEMTRWLLSPLVPLNLAFCFVFVCRKRPITSNGFRSPKY